MQILQLGCLEKHIQFGIKAGVFVTLDLNICILLLAATFYNFL